MSKRTTGTKVQGCETDQCRGRETTGHQEHCRKDMGPELTDVSMESVSLPWALRTRMWVQIALCGRPGCLAPALSARSLPTINKCP